MRTTLNLDDYLIREAKNAAVRTGRTLSQVVEDSLRAALAKAPTSDVRPRLPTSPGRPRRGVDLDDSAGLRDVMDEPE